MATTSDSHASELRLKLHEGLVAHSVSAGFPLLSGSFQEAILNRAFAELSSLGPSQIATLSLSSDKLTTAVASSFNTIISQLSAPQQLALRAGLDPFSAAVAHAINSPDGIAGLLAGGNGRQAISSTDTRSGWRFGELLRGDADARAEARNSYAGLALDSATLASLRNAGLSRDIFDDLSQHYTTEQIRTAADFASDLGVGADAYAGKFAGLDAESRNDLHTFVDEMREDPALTDEAKLKEIRSFRAEHPELQGLSDADLLNIVNAKQEHVVAELGNEAAEVTSGTEVSDTLGHVSKEVAALNTKVEAEAAASSSSEVAASVDDAFGVTATPSSTEAATIAAAKPKALVRPGPAV